MKNKTGFSFSLALLLCVVTATAVSALVIVHEEVHPFHCGSGATTELFPLPPGTREFGIARTSTAILAKVEANSNSTAGYQSRVYLRKGNGDGFVKDVIIYFNPKDDSTRGARLGDLTVLIEYIYRVRSSFGDRVRSVLRTARFNNLEAAEKVPGSGGWRSVKIGLGVNEPTEVAEVRLQVFLQNDSNRDETVTFGKVELSPIDGVYPTSFVTAPEGCIGDRR